MKIITYSDLHLEFGTDFRPPENCNADLMILAGDIITFQDFAPIGRFLEDWKKPALYVAGNHEYYTKYPMDAGDRAFRDWLNDHHSNVTVLQDEAITIDGIHFFGGTMWTDFAGANRRAMITADQQMNDYRLIILPNGQQLNPLDTIDFHKIFVHNLLSWFDQSLIGPCVVISHNAPVLNPNTRYADSPLMPAFNSLDMVEIIEKHQPDLWVYGHTHECDDQTIGKTRIISNQLGYPDKFGGYECAGFDGEGRLIEL